MELEKVSGISAKTLNNLNKLGIKTEQDLKTYYPYRYNIIKKTITEEKIITDGVIIKEAKVTYLKNKRDKMTLEIENYEVVIFNRGYLKNQLTKNKNITIIGKLNENKIIATEIKLGLIDENPIIEPIYHTVKGITSLQINNLVNKINIKFPELIPKDIKRKYNFLEKEECLKNIHNPKTEQQLYQAINQIKYEELFIFMIKINYLKQNKKIKGLYRPINQKKLELMLKKIPFKLTEDQLTTSKEIYNDLTSGKRMNRLILGDVGSGKTIISIIALYMNYLSSYQGALMVPTEILATQHYEYIKKILPDLNIKLLTGKTKNKSKIRSELKNKEIDIIIGTHALTSKKVEYNNLGLVITDEQHRFGVNQRAELKNKGKKPDILYLSATPIPRTYAITLFGDMDISTIKSKPEGRLENLTYLKNNTQITEVLKMMYQEIKKGYQVYVIAPLIEESEKIDLENVMKLKDKMELAFGKICNIDIMHSKLSTKQKEVAMKKFHSNQTQILISTTVIEVGVDVKNATCMVVFDAHRFGLAALHQLRGRIGRNNVQSYFILISDIEAKRLEILTKTNDGFKISEADLKLRGSGDFFGIKQSGDMQFKLADLNKDYKLLMAAKDDSIEQLKHNKTKILQTITTIKQLD